MHRTMWLKTAIAVLVLLGTTAIEAGKFENEVRARWRGAWVVLESEAYSNCAGGYHNNKLAGTFVTGQGARRFEPGEIAKVDKVQVRRSKVELFVTLDVPVLIAYPSGPFTLYSERECGLELSVRVPRDTVKRQDVAAVDRLLDPLATRFDTRERAYAADLWNGREREEYPPDYELTLARHAAWEAEQHNLSIDAKQAIALDQARTAATAIEDDPDYLQGLAAGAREMKRWRAVGCGQLLGRGFHAVRTSPPEERREDTEENESWRAGFTDGQRLVYSLTLLEQLDECYVPVPPVRGEGESDEGVASLR